MKNWLVEMFLIKSFNIGAEINIEEYVPIINPHIKIYEKSLRAIPPNKAVHLVAIAHPINIPDKIKCHSFPSFLIYKNIK